MNFKTGIANRAMKPMLGIVDTLNTRSCSRGVYDLLSYWRGSSHNIRNPYQCRSRRTFPQLGELYCHPVSRGSRAQQTRLMTSSALTVIRSGCRDRRILFCDRHIKEATPSRTFSPCGRCELQWRCSRGLQKIKKTTKHCRTCCKQNKSTPFRRSLFKYRSQACCFFRGYRFW